MTTPRSERSLFANEPFLDQLTKLLAHDAKALHDVRSMLEANDFKPLRGMQWGNQRWVVADRCMQYYDRFHQPVGTLLHADILEYATNLQLNERQVDLLDSYLTHLETVKTVNPVAIIEKVAAFKMQHIKADVIEELTTLQAGGQLDDAKWTELFKRGLPKISHTQAVDYFNTLDSRIDKRSLKGQYGQNPRSFIEPLDAIVNPPLGPKQLGLIIAPTNRGKSLFLLWMALVYSLQYTNTLYITLEDALEEVETRLDSAVTKIPFLQLETRQKELKELFGSYQRLVNAKLHIIDGTEEKYTVAMVERAILDQRSQGFMPQALIIDYDDYLVSTTHMRDRRQEVDQVYRDLKTLGAQYNLITWTAAQTQRNTSKLKVLSGDKVADDIGKIRKCTIAISMGKGELGDDSFYLWVAKHKFGKSNVGCSIIPDLESQTIYDHEVTRKALDAKAEKENSGEEELGE